MDLYREEILEHWKNPQNFGEIENADLVIDQINPLCGDQIRFFFKIARGPVSSFLPASARSRRRSRRNQSDDVDLRAVGNPSTVATPRIDGKSIVKDVSFTGNGCAISIASASMLSQYIKGKKILAISKITGGDVLAMIGGAVTPARLKCAFLPLEALRKLGVNYEESKGSS